MVNVDDYKEVKDCIYKDEHYSVRDNGAVMRHQRAGMRKRKLDGVWSFGTPKCQQGQVFDNKDGRGKSEYETIILRIHSGINPIAYIKRKKGQMMTVNIPV